VLDEAVAIARTGWRPRIQVAGQSDTARSAAYNQALFERRAATVAPVPRPGRRFRPDRDGRARGESQLLRATTDGVYDSCNRWVELDMS